MKRQAAILGLLLLAAGIAPAAVRADHEWTVKELHQECLSEDEAIKNSCMAFIAGVVETMLIYGQEIILAPDYRDDFAICPTGAVGLREAYEIFLTWAERHPEAADRHQGNGVMTAIRERWACD
jgi:hypothetical protein